MLSSFKFNINKKVFYVVVVLLVYSFLQGAIILLLFLSNSKEHLSKTVARIDEDLVFSEGKWDVSAYNADGGIQDGHSVYIITTEGFVVERFKPIHGVLDLSRYTILDNYLTPTTETTVTDEKWRMFSMPVEQNGKALGIILVAYYEPKEESLEEIDKRILDVANYVKGNIRLENESMDLSQVDVRKTPYDISFQIVNNFNKVLLQSNSTNSVGRMPVFIDRSYIDHQLRSSQTKQVTDSISGKKHLLVTQPVLDEGGGIVGVIVAGESIDHLYTQGLAYMGIIFLLNLLIVSLYKPVVKMYSKIASRNKPLTAVAKPLPKEIKFMKKACKISIDSTSIDIPYASFQYYFCDALFSRPKKRWEVDELLELFGEESEPEKWRKIYDTMVALNRKTSGLTDKLFVVKDKRYFIDPRVVTVVSYVNS